MIEEAQLRLWLAEGKTVWHVMELVPCSRNTVQNYLRRYQIETPKGFFRREGKKPGRPKGIPHTPEFLAMLSERFKGEGNPFYGRKHDAATKAKMSGPRPHISGDKNPFRRSVEASQELREAHRERARRRWANYTPEQKEEISRKFSKAQCANPHHADNAHKRHKHGHHVSVKAGRVFYRSAWELKVMRKLDGHPDVARYEVEPCAIPYATAGGQTRFTKPDFLIIFTSGHRLMAEVKPRALLAMSNNAQKVVGQKAYCEEQGIQHVLLTKDEIFGRDTLSELLDAAGRGELLSGAPC